MNREDFAGNAIPLPEVMDISGAENLLASLRDNVHPGVECRLDAASVRILTTPCAQILLAAAKDCAQLWIENPSPEFVEAVADLGISDHLSKRIRYS